MVRPRRLGPWGRSAEQIESSGGVGGVGGAGPADSRTDLPAQGCSQAPLPARLAAPPAPPQPARSPRRGTGPEARPVWPAQLLGLRVMPPGSKSPGSPAVPSLHNGVQKPWGDNLEEEKQGRRSGFPGCRGPRHPQRAFHPPPRQAQGALWALLSPWKCESIRVREGRRQAPHPRLGPPQKLPRSRSCPRVHAGERSLPTKP